MGISSILTYIGIGLGGSILLWYLWYFIFMELIAAKYFRKYIGPQKKIEEYNKIEKLRLVFYRRYQSYNLIAYFILIISTALLLICIALFINANQVVADSGKTKVDDITFLLITSISIRIGIVFIAFFIAQNLYKLYKHNLKLSNFYTTIFDSILAKDALEMKLEDLVKTLSPDAELGEIEKAPTQELLEVLKQLKSTK